MSRIADLGEQYKNLPDVLDDFRNDLSKAEAELQIRGKSLERANQENPSFKYYYHQRMVQLNTLVKYFEQEVERVRGKLFKSLTENNNRDLSDRAKDKYIDNEQKYLDTNELYLEVKEVRDMYEALVDAFRDRGYALKNITEARVAQLEDVLLN